MMIRKEGEWLKVGQKVRLLRKQNILASMWYKDLHERVKSGDPIIEEVLRNEYGTGYVVLFPNGERMRVWDPDVEPVGEFLGLSTPETRRKEYGINYWKQFKTLEELKKEGEELAKVLKENPKMAEHKWVEALREGYKVRLKELKAAAE